MQKSNRIRVLDSLLANKIAAGEVVERPSSVVKELIENSIDAGSKNITIEILEGGKNLIKIIDDGIGIEKEDVEIAFLRHATSKIKNENDLNNILTLGFRGEALSSIASVSKITIITKTENCDSASIVQIIGGEVISREEIGGPRGTTIVVEDLFFNTPARKKYLKGDNVESSSINEIVQGLALGNPSISFKFYNNGRLVFHSPGNNDIMSTAVYVLGRDICKSMVRLSEHKDIITINGIVAKPEISKGNRSQQYVYVNGRLISSNLITKAVEDGYKELLTVGRYPIFVIYLDVNPNLIDVNIHPTKADIKFLTDLEIYENITKAVKKCLSSNMDVPHIDKSILKDVFRQEIQQPEKDETQLSMGTLSKEKPNSISGKESYISSNNKISSYKEPLGWRSSEKSFTIQQPVISKHQDEVEAHLLKEQRDRDSYKLNNTDINKTGDAPGEIEHLKIIGQIFDTYIIVEGNDYIYIVDQHAAHERIVYEKLLSQFQANTRLSQTLIQPIILELTHKEFTAVSQNLSLFSKLGFNLEEFGQNSYIIREVPFVLGKPYSKDFFMNIVDQLCNGEIALTRDNRLKDLISIACKASIKANDNLDISEMQWLIDTMPKAINPYNCPHGRPTSIKMTKYQLEKMFKRIL